MKLDTVLFLLGLGAVALGAALFGTDAGTLLFVAGCVAMILAPMITFARKDGGR